jgi:hypothetical protein
MSKDEKVGPTLQVPHDDVTMLLCVSASVLLQSRINSMDKGCQIVEV